MPFFPEGQDPLDQGAQPLGRLPLGGIEAPYARQLQEQQQHEQNIAVAEALFFFLILGVALLFGVVLLFRRRRALMAAADKAAVTTLSKGIQASRTASQILGDYRKRATELADQSALKKNHK